MTTDELDQVNEGATTEPGNGEPAARQFILLAGSFQEGQRLRQIGGGPGGVALRQGDFA